MEKEATLGLPGAKNMFEELQATHQRQADITHQVVRASFFDVILSPTSVSNMELGRLPSLPSAPDACP